MDILKLSVLRGPNYWSNYRKKLIVIKLDLKEYEFYPTNLLSGFTDALTNLIPSLYGHHCSAKAPGGFINRLREGTWLGHVIEHVALELQTLAGMPCGFGRTRSQKEKGVYDVVFAYDIEDAGLYAAKAAFEIVKTLAENKVYPDLQKDISALQIIRKNETFGPSTKSIIDEAKKRHIPVTVLNDRSLVLLGDGCYQKMIMATVSSNTSLVGADIAADKALTKKILAAEFIPVPLGVVIDSDETLDTVIQEIGFPLTIKPINANHGKGVTTHITNNIQAFTAFSRAQRFTEKVIVEKFVRGSDYRFLVINNKVAAIAERTPAKIIGTGLHTIQQLIDEINAHPKRGSGHEHSLSKIIIDDITNTILSKHHFSLDTILPAGEVCYLKYAANLSAGGTATDVTSIAHEYNIFLAERIARLLHLDICGIDIIAEDITLPISEKNGAVIEVNTGPGFRMHLDPTEGEPRDVAKPVIDMLFPPNKPFRIPITAVTGTNGKTTVVRLIAYLAKHAGYSVGYSTTDGIYINDKMIAEGDCSGPHSAKRVLRDPIVEFAVLETARGGILRAGLGFDNCHVSIITNISEEHLGFDDIQTLDQLIRVKSVVAHSTLKDGHAILNADDKHVLALKDELDCHIALFSSYDNNPNVLLHCNSGGLAAYIEDNFLIVRKGKVITRIADISILNATFYGTSTFMIKNVLAAVLACTIHQIDSHSLAKALQGFKLSPETTPGRMNLFNFKNFKVLIDYAHNADAFLNLKDYIEKNAYAKKIGIIAATGNRRDEDIINVGKQAAEIFDEIIIRHDKDSRGRTNEILTALLMQGIQSVEKATQVEIISDEFDAIDAALEKATKDSIIFYFPDDIFKAINYVKEKAEKSAHPAKKFPFLREA